MTLIIPGGWEQGGQRTSTSLHTQLGDQCATEKILQVLVSNQGPLQFKLTALPNELTRNEDKGDLTYTFPKLHKKGTVQKSYKNNSTIKSINLLV